MQKRVFHSNPLDNLAVAQVFRKQNFRTAAQCRCHDHGIPKGLLISPLNLRGVKNRSDRRYLDLPDTIGADQSACGCRR